MNLTLLSDKLKVNLADYSLIFQEKLADGFGIKEDPLFLVIPATDEVPLVRDITTSILQPGRKGTTNFTENAVSLDDRIAKLRPFKADLKITEQQIYGWSKLWAATRKKTDPTDIYSFPAMEYYMGRIINRAGRDILGVIHDGVYNASGTTFVDIADGLKIQMTLGVATTGTGAVSDIPVGNSIAAASTIDQSNVISEINKFALKLAAGVDLPKDEPATLCLDSTTFLYMVNASASALTNGQAVVTFSDNKWRLSAFPNTIIEAKSWLSTSGAIGKMMWTTHGNLVVLTPETKEDVPSIEIEKADRNLKIFVDGEIAYNYIDGRYILFNTKTIA